MWLQNLLFLGTVVCSISAPTRSPTLVTRPSQHVDAIQEALSLLNNSNDVTAVMNKAVKVVSEVFDPEVRCFSLTCLPRDLYRGGVRGGVAPFHMDSHRVESPCATQNINFKSFKENLKDFLFNIPFDCWKPVKK
uniref:Granulocyte-macrophage colony-stimulating factor n=2 Tax=Canis lupus TaxID=9612 RepID=A0A8C0Q7D6_CANLF